MLVYKMLNFLKQTRKFINTKQATCIVLGNESCDLDSACSALCLAYFLHEGTEIAPQKHIKATQFLPVLNIPRCDFPLKTEVQYLLRKYNIEESTLTFRDELHDDFLARSEFILVDHHVSPFAAQCVAIYDHRPKDESAKFPSGCYVSMDLVGSCATLIADAFLDKTNGCIEIEKHLVAYNLLRDTIILDTVNFSPNASRFTARDEQICLRLEYLLKSQSKFQERDAIFQELCKARADVSVLTASQLLRKDLKILRNSSESLCIALPGFPLQVQQFIKKPDAEAALREFAAEHKCDLILLIGMFVREDNSVERDIGLVSIDGNADLRNLVEARLLESQEAALNLELFENCDFLNGRFYKQNNIKATRKHILPIVKRALEKWETK